MKSTKLQYQESKKIRRVSTNHITETTISNGSPLHGGFRFAVGSWFERGDNAEGKIEYNKTTLEIMRKGGAGISVEITRFSEKRTLSQSFELGKSDVEFLIEYLQEVKGELRDFNGEFVPAELESF